jgi:hypothetical protein
VPALRPSLHRKRSPEGHGTAPPERVPRRGTEDARDAPERLAEPAQCHIEMARSARRPITRRPTRRQPSWASSPQAGYFSTRPDSSVATWAWLSGVRPHGGLAPPAAGSSSPPGPDRWSIHPPPAGSMEHRTGPDRACYEIPGAHETRGTRDTAPARNSQERSRTHATSWWLPAGDIGGALAGTVRQLRRTMRRRGRRPAPSDARRPVRRSPARPILIVRRTFNDLGALTHPVVVDPGVARRAMARMTGVLFHVNHRLAAASSGAARRARS